MSTKTKCMRDLRASGLSKETIEAINCINQKSVFAVGGSEDLFIDQYWAKAEGSSLKNLAPLEQNKIYVKKKIDGVKLFAFDKGTLKSCIFKTNGVGLGVLS